MESSPPGWYRDPKRPGGMSYWDGHAWVDVDGVVDGHQAAPPAGSSPRLISQRRGDQQDVVSAEVAEEVDTESQAD
jgi:Protein of unknown function (DUF2510)